MTKREGERTFSLSASQSGAWGHLAKALPRILQKSPLWSWPRGCITARCTPHFHATASRCWRAAGSTPTRWCSRGGRKSWVSRARWCVLSHLWRPRSRPRQWACWRLQNTSSPLSKVLLCVASRWWDKNADLSQENGIGSCCERRLGRWARCNQTCRRKSRRPGSRPGSPRFAWVGRAHNKRVKKNVVWVH